jgi:hypothetical protein
MKEYEIKNLIGMVTGDIIVDIDIRFKEIAPIESVEAKLAKQKVEADLGALAFKLKQYIKDEIKSHFSNNV